MSARRTLFAATVPGLEDALRSELLELHGPRVAASGFRAGPGGVEFDGDDDSWVRTLLRSKIAESVRLRLRRARVTTFEQLVDETRKVPWHAYLPADAALRVQAVCHKSRLYHSDAVAERVEGAIRDARRLMAGVGEPFVIHVRLDHDELTLSIDSSGERLHRRGYRLHTVPAPVRETLAAAVLRLAQLTPQQPLWDPFCGSGTFCFEHTLQLAELVSHRRFAAERFPTAPHQSFAAARDVATTAVAPPVWGSDLSGEAIAAAQANQRVWPGAFPTVQFSVADFEQAARDIPSGTAVVTNPPYGLRLLGERGDRRALTALYGRFESLLERRVDLAPVVLLCGDRHFLKEHRLRWRRLGSFPNGGASVTVLALDR